MALCGFQRRRRMLAQKQAELEAVQEVKTLADLTKTELLDICTERGIEVNSRATKAEIITLLEGE